MPRSVSIDAPSAASVTDLVVWGPRGRSWMPAGSLPPEAALGVALSELMVAAKSGQVEHPCDVRFGRDVVDVLAEAGEQLKHRES